MESWELKQGDQSFTFSNVIFSEITRCALSSLSSCIHSLNKPLTCGFQLLLIRKALNIHLYLWKLNSRPDFQNHLNLCFLPRSLSIVMFICITVLIISNDSNLLLNHIHSTHIKHKVIFANKHGYNFLHNFQLKTRRNSSFCYWCLHVI